MPQRAICFDVMGTLFDLGVARDRLVALGVPGETLEVWFARTLHAASVLTIVGEYRPFPEIAEPVLRSVLAQQNANPAGAIEVIESLGSLEPYDDTEAALELASEADVRVVALTNGTALNTDGLLQRSGLASFVDEIVTTEAVRAYKPHPSVYRCAAEILGLPPAQATLIAAHAWDVIGARSAGMGAVWVSRLERQWPLPLEPTPTALDLLAAVRIVLEAPVG